MTWPLGIAETQRRISNGELTKEFIAIEDADFSFELALEAHASAWANTAAGRYNMAVLSLWDATLLSLVYLLSLQNLRITGADLHAIAIESAVDQFLPMDGILRPLKELRRRRNALYNSEHDVLRGSREEATLYFGLVGQLLVETATLADSGKVSAFSL